MDLTILKSAFEVRVGFDWALLAEAAAQGKVSVNSFVLTAYHELRGLFHPWYEVLGRPAGWDWVGAMQIPVLDLVANPDLITADRRESIAKIEQSFRIRRDDGVCVPAQLTLLAYDLGGEDGRRQLVVDGSHRLAAIARLATQGWGWPFRLLVHSVKGPIDGKICPDLYYHGGNVLPAALLKQPE